MFEDSLWDGLQNNPAPPPPPIWNANNQWLCMFWFAEKLSIKPAQNENRLFSLRWPVQPCIQMFTDLSLFRVKRKKKSLKILMAKEWLGPASPYHHLCIFIYTFTIFHLQLSFVHIFFDTAWMSTAFKCGNISSVLNTDTPPLWIKNTVGITSCLQFSQTEWSVLTKSSYDNNICLFHHFPLTSPAILIFPRNLMAATLGAGSIKLLTTSLYSSKSYRITKWISKPSRSQQASSRHTEFAKSSSSYLWIVSQDFVVDLYFCFKNCLYEVFAMEVFWLRSGWRWFLSGT